MERRQKLIYGLGGFALGVLLTCAAWMGAGASGSGGSLAAEGGLPEASAAPGTELEETAVYTGGDTASYKGRRYRAKWWTQGETPGSSDVWEDLGIADGVPVQPQGADDVPIDASAPQNTELADFKVVGYYPSWKPDRLQAVDFGVVTHVCYAFAIPTAEGDLLPLENPETARELIRAAHQNGAKVLLSVGGWSYNDMPLEHVFMEATAAGAERLAGNIMDMCRQYGFDGVDTITEKTRYAKENLGGIMIWELTQDTSDPGWSLLQAIGRSAK